jgi:hypothetical protein
MLCGVIRHYTWPQAHPSKKLPSRSGPLLALLGHRKIADRRPLSSCRIVRHPSVGSIFYDHLMA